MSSPTRRSSVISRSCDNCFLPDLHPANRPDISPDEYFFLLSVMPLPTPLLWKPLVMRLGQSTYVWTDNPVCWQNLRKALCYLKMCTCKYASFKSRDIAQSPCLIIFITFVIVSILKCNFRRYWLSLNWSLASFVFVTRNNVL